MQIRDAVEVDFEQITAIYNEVLTHSTAIYNDRPFTIEERLTWWRSRQDQAYPVLVAADDNHIDSENAASLRFLERFGFERVAHLREVGFKFDRYLDLVFLQYWLSPPMKTRN